LRHELKTGILTQEFLPRRNMHSDALPKQINELDSSASAGRQTLSLGDIAKLVGGKLYGSPEASIENLKPLELAGPKDLSFFAPNSRKAKTALEALLSSSSAGGLLVKERITSISIPQIEVDNPMAAVIEIAKRFRPQINPAPGAHPTAVVDPSAKLGEGVAIGAYAVIGPDVVIGARSVIHPHVVIYPGASIGADCIIHSNAVIREFVVLGDDCLLQNGAVIGGDGFGYIPDKEHGHRRIPHLGTVVIGDGVDLGANATIDRGTLGATVVGRQTKIDNLVMVGHNCQIGERNIFCSQVGISGSTTIGSNVILGGKVGVADHIKIGDGARIAARSGITGHVEAGAQVGGFPARPLSDWRRIEAVISNLPRLAREVRELKQGLAAQVEREQRGLNDSLVGANSLVGAISQRPADESFSSDIVMLIEKPDSTASSDDPTS
jgi:UDP-3-O-[3-hydroxymyristoyl] glucosamine N-acyltransferase